MELIVFLKNGNTLKFENVSNELLYGIVLRLRERIEPQKEKCSIQLCTLSRGII